MRIALAFLAACSFEPGSLPNQAVDALGDVASSSDAAPDVASLAFCPTDTHLRLCFSFDQPTLGTSLPNEGAAAVTAQLTNVTRIASTGGGGAAQLDATSTIWMPMGSGVTGIQTIEVWYRADTAIATDGGRMGLVDSNVVPQNISLFFYRQDPAHTLRCGIGEQTTVWNATLAINTWTHLVCTCDGGNLKMYVNGINVGDTPGTCGSGGGLVTDGLTLGSNNNGGPSGVNDWLLGAIDGVRLWDVPLSAPM